MSRWIILSDAPATERDITARAAAAAALPGVRHCSGGVDLPGSAGGRGAVWDLHADRTPEQALPGLDGDAVRLEPLRALTVPLGGPGRIKRTLLLTVRAGTPAAVIARFEADLTAMPGHIAAIKSWSLSRVSGHARWTHAWEQEFADADGLNGDYLLHPYHWTHVDRWFDSEIPGSIVTPEIAHLYRRADGAVLGQ